MKKFSIYSLKKAKEDSLLPSLSLEGYRIVQGGVHVYRPGEISHKGEKHVHEQPEIFIGLDGEATMMVNGREYSFRGGEIILIEPGEEHHVIASKDNPITLVWLDVERMEP
ncbi:MAG: cupin domain-containing protein [Thermoprotei archaeon]|nr:cupin domain-containing protein [Thermoprotei archaeon]